MDNNYQIVVQDYIGLTITPKPGRTISIALAVSVENTCAARKSTLG